MSFRRWARLGLNLSIQPFLHQNYNLSQSRSNFVKSTDDGF